MTIYAYPWDLARVGVERALKQICADGISAIDLTASYHPIDALSPREGVSIFTNARGAVYFPPRDERYGRIKPHVHSPEISAIWPETARHAHALGLDLNAWTITLFQPWIRDAHPDCARVFPSGNPSGSGVCPANDDVREFLVTMCEDMVDQFGIKLVRLENIMPVFDFDWLRPRTLITVPPFARTLMNLCFCNACITKAVAKGLDPVRLREIVNTAINSDISEGCSNDHRTAALADDAELRAYAELAMRSSTELVTAIAAAIKGKARVSINAAASYAMLIGTAREDELLGEFLSAADQAELIPGHPDNAHVAALAGGLAPPREISAMIPVVRATGLTGPALQARLAAPEARVQAAVDAGATELSLYNFGLLRESDISEFAASIRRDFG
jgi:hypothetical protein